MHIIVRMQGPSLSRTQEGEVGAMTIESICEYRTNTIRVRLPDIDRIDAHSIQVRDTVVGTLAQGGRFALKYSMCNYFW